jgi:hypothetical protein
MTALQVIIKEAKAIRSKNPKMEWKKAVAQASAIYASKHKGKSPVGKKKVTKKVAKKKAVGKYVKTVRKGKITDVIYKRKKISGVKRKPTEKAVLKSIKHAVSVQKSHMSGMDHYPIRFTRITNDVYGNPRYVVHYPEFLNNEENTFIPFSKKYEYALKKAKKLGGKKFDNKQYGGGIVFQSYNIEDLEKKIISLRHTTPKIKI